jgi:hypothetical protein
MWSRIFDFWSLILFWFLFFVLGALFFAVEAWKGRLFLCKQQNNWTSIRVQRTKLQEQRTKSNIQDQKPSLIAIFGHRSNYRKYRERNQD